MQIEFDEMNVDQKVSENLNYYLNTNLLTTLNSFGLNILNFQCFFKVFDGMFMNKDFNVLKDVLVSGFLKFSQDLIDRNFQLLN